MRMTATITARGDSPSLMGQPYQRGGTPHIFWISFACHGASLILNYLGNRARTETGNNGETT